MHSYGRKFIGAGRRDHHLGDGASRQHRPVADALRRKRCAPRVIPMNDAGELLIDEYDGLLNERTKLVAVMHVSNALGTINPIKEMIATAHKYGVPVLIDGAQAAPHMPIDMQDLDADFYVFSGHKMFAPTGSGVVYGKLELLER
jgi:cysteine desulfurase/selenocysteine lyase